MPGFEALTLQSLQLDDAFFAARQAEFSGTDLAQQVAEVLKSVMTVKRPDGTEKSYQEIVADTQQIFANPRVRAYEAVANQATVRFALACLQHQHGAELASSPELGAIFETGIGKLFGDRHDHDDHTYKDSETDKKKSAKKRKSFSWFTQKLVSLKLIKSA